MAVARPGGDGPSLVLPVKDVDHGVMSLPEKASNVHHPQLDDVTKTNSIGYWLAHPDQIKETSDGD